MSILPLKWESKIGSKEPKNRQNLTLQTPSNTVEQKSPDSQIGL